MNRLTPLPNPAPVQTFGHALDAKARKRLVLDAAARLFERRGYHGTSMQDIANEVGITKAALYHYVKSKDQLLFEIHDAFISTMLDDAEVFLAKEEDPTKQLAFMVESIFNAVSTYRPYVRAFFQDMHHVEGAEWYEMIKLKRDTYEAMLQDCLSRGLESGAFSFDLSPRMASMFVFGACNWSYQWMDPEGRLSTEEIIADWQNLIMRTFGAK